MRGPSPIRACCWWAASSRVCAVVGKVVAGWAPFWWKGRKLVIGVGMIPRGEVGLIFATAGVVTGVLDDKLFAACAMMVMVTTFLAPILLKQLLTQARGRPGPGRAGECGSGFEGLKAGKAGTGGRGARRVGVACHFWTLFRPAA